MEEVVQDILFHPVNNRLIFKFMLQVILHKSVYRGLSRYTAA